MEIKLDHGEQFVDQLAEITGRAEMALKGIDGLEDGQDCHPHEVAIRWTVKNALVVDDATRASARRWIIGSALRDALEAIFPLLDDFGAACHMMMEGGSIELFSPMQSERELLRLMMAPGRAIMSRHRGVEKKLSVLAKRYGMHSKYADSLLSIAKLRNCIVHRKGIVVPKLDTTDEKQSELRVNYFAIRSEVLDRATGKWRPLSHPGDVAGAATARISSHQSHSLAFPVGLPVEVSMAEFYGISMSLYLTGWNMQKQFDELVADSDGLSKSFEVIHSYEEK